MKTAALVLSALALAAPVQAALTPHSTAYDLFTVRVYEAFGAVGEIVFKREDPLLLTAFNSLLSEAEQAVAAGTQKYPYYNDRLADFFDAAANFDSSYKSLPDEYDAADVSFTSFMGNSPRAYLDVVFDTVEATLPALQNQTFADWHGAARLALEQRVQDGASAVSLAGETRAYLNGLSANAAAAKRFEAASSELEKRMRQEFQMTR